MSSRVLFVEDDADVQLIVADLLRGRGYRQSDPTTTMFKRIEPSPAPAEVEVRDAVSPEWLQVYLGEITENRRAVNTRILEQIPAPRAFFGYRREGEIIATALCAIGFGRAGRRLDRPAGRQPERSSRRALRKHGLRRRGDQHLLGPIGTWRDGGRSQTGLTFSQYSSR